MSEPGFELGVVRLAPLLDYVSDGIFIVGPDRRICEFNPAAERIASIPAAEALGKTCHSIFTGVDDGPECAVTGKPPCTIETVFRTGVPCAECEGAVVFPRGSRRALTFRAVPLFGPDGGVGRVAVIIHDVSRIHELEQELEERYEFHNIVGKNHRMREIFTLIEQIADTDATVLIEGESGTGKELVARAIHFQSRRAKKPFVTVNCSALVETLLESELFGHVRGAFTGAVRDKVGRFEAANTGSIFMDEIGDISPAVQAKLLRVIQERQFERVGESTTRTTDVRIITATHRDLRARMEQGLFREDLYYRLRVVPIRLPPLRERREDIPLLVNAFMQRFSARMGKTITAIASAALARLMDYSWPGNVRELENAIEHAFVRCTGKEIGVQDLPVEVRTAEVPVRVAAGGGSMVAGTALPEPPPGVPPHPNESDERTIIRAALDAAGGSKSLAARRLGISRTTLWRRMKELGITLPRYPGPFRGATSETPDVPQ